MLQPYNSFLIISLFKLKNKSLLLKKDKNFKSQKICLPALQNIKPYKSHSTLLPLNSGFFLKQPMYKRGKRQKVEKYIIYRRDPCAHALAPANRHSTWEINSNINFADLMPYSMTSFK